jgi:hypothetical protein
MALALLAASLSLASPAHSSRDMTLPCEAMIKIVKGRMAVTTYTPEHAAALQRHLSRAERALAKGQRKTCRIHAHKALTMA